jgi:glucose-1-phosphatase
MIRTIVFDLGGVIVGFEFERAYRTIEKLSGLDTPQIRARIRETGLVPLLESGKIDPGEFVSRLTAALGVTMSYDEFSALWSSIFLPETLIPESLLEHLHRHHRLVLLSNTNAIHFEMIREAYPLLRHFDHFVLSHEVGAMKPAPEIYREAIRHALCLPEECFYTDDVLEFVEGARREGMDSGQFLGFEKLKADLALRGVTTG